MASEHDHAPPRHTSESSGELDVTPPEDRVCGFCNQDHAEGLRAAVDFIDIPTRTNVWATDRPVRHGNRSFWCHTNCVHFSPQTKYNEERMTWCNIGTENMRARALICKICENKGIRPPESKGASIGCSVRECNVSVHFPCAIRERLPDGRKNWYPCQEATIPFFCLGHSAERAEHERSKEVDRLSDLTQGKEDREPYEDSKPYKVPADIGLAFRKFSSVLASPGTANGRGHGHGHGGGGGVTGTFDVASVAQQWGQLFPEFPLPRGLLTTPKSTDFTYVADTVDSKSAQVRQGPEREKRCCSCTGPASCRDPRKCECLQQGRQYSNKGRLLDEGHPPQVYECNLNCTCHKDECRNRLVQRGMACNIKVMYLGAKASSVSEGCGKWGIVAVEEIPARSFVCTVAGQLVIAGDLDGSLDDRGRHSSVLVHRVRDWTEWNARRAAAGGNVGGGGGGAGGDPSRAPPGVPPLAGGAQERFVDQRRYANISRYIRCAKSEKDVNLVRAAVHTKHQDPDAPVLALFAVRNIREGTELLRSR